jgi:hypothetical protein
MIKEFSYLVFGFASLIFPEFYTPYFSGDGFGQYFHKFNDSGNFEFGQHINGVLEEFQRQFP